MMLMLVQWNKASCPHGEMLMALHHMHSLAYGVMTPLDSSDRTGIASFIGHNDASFIQMMGMKAGVRVHLYAFLYGLKVECDEVYCDIL